MNLQREAVGTANTQKEPPAQAGGSSLYRYSRIQLTG